MKKSGIAQFIKFALLGLVASAAELLVFALFRYLVFRALETRAFQFFLFEYPVEDGGLAAFLAFALSYSAAQAVNFFLQRKYTFHAKNDPRIGALLYALTAIAVLLPVLGLPMLLTPLAIGWLGEPWGPLLVKLMTMTCSMLIQYPMNKYVIMRVGAKKQ